MLTVERVAEMLSYDANSGKLTWKIYMNSQAQAGQTAGSLNAQGYVSVGIDGKYYLGHRIAWLLHYGVWPSNQLDHIDHVRHNNRINNLVEVTQTENLKNKSKSRANTSQHTGIYQTDAGNWIARICVNRKQINLGTFKIIEEAITARQQANIAYGFHTNHGQ